MKHIKVFLSFFIMLIATMSSACQPSPQEAQYQKAESISAYEGNFSQNESLTDGIQLHYYAEVCVPDHSLTSGGFVAESYSDELVQRVYGALCGDTQPYQYAVTAQELIDYVAYGKSSLELLQDTLSEEAIQYEQTELDSILDDAKTAPSEKTPADLGKITEYDQGLVSVNMGGREDAVFQVLTSPRYMLFFSNYQFPSASNEPCKDPLKMSQDDAVALAEGILQKIGIQDEFSLVRAYEETVDYAFYQTYFDDSTKNRAHFLLYLRRIGDDSQLDDSRILLGTDNQYDLSFLQEYILFKIDDNGLLSFEWETPGEVQMEEEPQNVITFNDAVSIATDQMKVSFTKYTFEGADPENINVYISKIALGYIFSEGTGDMVNVLPAWEFYGYIVDESKSEGTDRYYDVNTKSWTDSYEDNVSLCVINALDGNVIDRIGKY